MVGGVKWIPSKEKESESEEAAPTLENVVDGLPSESQVESPKEVGADSPKMTPEEVSAAMEKADFSIKEEPEKPDALPEALMFDADTKITPKMIIEKAKELEEKRKQRIQAAPDVNKGPRVETRANGRRTIRHN